MTVPSGPNPTPAPSPLTVSGARRHAVSLMAQTKYFDELPDDVAATRRGRKKRATAHRIFKSAIELMQKDGYDGVSIEQICERAEVARATFFQHFANKAALMSVFSDVVRQRIEGELAVAEMTPEEQLRFIADHLQRLTDEVGAIAPEMIAAFITEPGAGFRIDDPGTGVARLIVGIVGEGQADGVFADHWSPEDVAICLVAAWVGVGRHRLSRPGARGETPLHGVLDLVLSGLTPR